MKTFLVIGGLLLAGLVACGVALAFWWIGMSNTEVRLRNQVEAAQVDNRNHMDKMLKTISQTAQVSEKQMAAIKEIIVGYASARGGSGGNLATSLTEAVPNIDSSSETFRRLMGIVESSRAQFTDKQTRLLDLAREHKNFVTTFPGSLLGRQPIEVKIVTSSRVENAFETGKDDDDRVFGPK